MHKIQNDGSVQDEVWVVGRNIPLGVQYYENAFAIRDTNNYRPNLDLSGFQRFQIWAFNSMDQDISVTLQKLDLGAPQNIQQWNGTAWAVAQITVPKGSTYYLLNTALPCLDRPFESLALRISASVAPTSGSITIKVVGVPN
ncbi:hypothetical protein GXP70_18130 [Paenibacillus lycopersici]|uniref:Uncharacterized protein n=1 Tax=Paenibacillus lycopersici TaxID=2704462 RepID=A0A6C0G1D6_9BACL|nr:hypothetical protein [Paenibacillus lycopersici]QHT61703.1 hypothetical protein GXP70_18130 [Paenibacillus lycopersici]